jgi:hypothetical protein
MATTATAPLSSRAVFTGSVMASIPDVTLPVSRLVRVEVIERPFATLWQRSIVTATRIIAIVNVAVKAVTAVKPGASSDKKSAIEPIRSIVAIRRTAVGGVVVITVRTVRGYAYVNANLGLSIASGGRQPDSHNC